MIIFSGSAANLFKEASLPPDLQMAVNQWQSGFVKLTTSGSTGKPKEIVLSKEILDWSVQQTIKYASLSLKEKVLCPLPLTKIGGRMMLVRSWVNDWEIQIQTPSANPLLEVSADHQFTFTSLVPYQLATILNHPESTEKLKRFSKILIGGAGLSTELEGKAQQFLSSCNVEMFHTYGMTETASHIALRNFRTMPPNQFKVFEDVKVMTNTEGCFRFQIPKLALDVTTNDMGEVTDSIITFLSRSDEVVNSGGIKLHLSEIRKQIDKILEKIAVKCNYILWKEADTKLGEKLIFIGLHNPNEAKIIDSLTQKLSGVNRPKKFYWTDAYKRTESGKIDRQKTAESLVEIGS